MNPRNRRKETKPKKPKENIKKAYSKIKPILTQAQIKLKGLLLRVIESIEDKKLVRARLDNIRIKDSDSVKRKFQIKLGNADDIEKSQLSILDIKDLVGGHIVCNNIQDVYRFVELLRDILPGDSGLEIQDYIKQPNNLGYRAIHVNIKIQVGKPIHNKFINCEVQIRTLLQDSFAKLTHTDVYKEGDDLPKELIDRTVDLSEILHTSDNIANRQRDSISKSRTPPEKRPNLNKLTKDGLTHIFQEVFGTRPSEYVVQLAYNTCGKLRVSKISKLTTVLRDADFRKKVDEVYIGKINIPATKEDFFILAIYAVEKGNRSALAKAIKEAEELWNEANQMHRSDLFNYLPDTLPEFIEMLRDSYDPMELAEAWNANLNCERCGADLIDPEYFEEQIYDYYGMDVLDGEVSSLIVNSGLEIPDLEESGLCCACAHQKHKD